MRINTYPKHGLQGKRYRETFERLFNEQQGRCLICGIHQDEIRHPRPCLRKLNIDHCHVTGKIRGLLCNGCNMYFGYFEQLGGERFDTIPDGYPVLDLMRVKEFFEQHKAAIRLYLQRTS